VRFRPKKDRTYGRTEAGWEAQWSDAEEVKAIRHLKLQLPPVEQNEPIAGRIWNTYAPVIAVARLLGDSEFEIQLMKKMEGITITLREAQGTSELDAIAVRALIECISKTGTLRLGEGVSLREIRDLIWKNTGLTANPSQLGAILGDLNFEKRKAHGVTKIFPTAATLIKACQELGIEDEAIDQLRRELGSKSG
jgi:hypothetical protein